MGRSPESPFPFAPCPTPVEQALEAVEDDEKSAPIPMMRRTSFFYLKRKLSKVDIRLKNPLKDKRDSVVCNDNSPIQDLCNDLEEVDTSPDSEENTVVENESLTDVSLKNDTQKKSTEDFINSGQFSPEEEPEIPFLVGSVGANIDSRKVNFVSRPDNLDLLDENGAPVRPPRYKKKQPDKRDHRLLSVPNIKFQKTEQNFKDLRDRDDVTVVSPQPTFTGNLMRRFSKF